VKLLFKVSINSTKLIFEASPLEKDDHLFTALLHKAPNVKAIKFKPI